MKNYIIIITTLLFSLGYAQTKKEASTQRLIDSGGGCVTYYYDEDGDGWAPIDAETDCLPSGTYPNWTRNTGDCDDLDANIYPRTWYMDGDGDGFGNFTIVGKHCYPPQQNAVLVNGDCNDNSNTVYPKNWYADNDGDGVGGTFLGLACTAPQVNAIVTGGDCNDNDRTVFVTSTWYEDVDLDGFGDPAVSVVACGKPAGYVENNLDLCPREYSSTDPRGCQRFTDDNYVHTKKFRKPVTGISQIVSREDLIENITYFDGIGRPKQEIAIAHGNMNKINNDLLNTKSVWTLGSGTVGQFTQNGNTAENNRVMGANPFGQNEILWKCGSDTASDADGGWNHTISIDKNKAYRYTVWVKRTGSLNGYAHHGTSNVLNLDGTTNANPYFWFNSIPELDKWYLLVGYIHPASYSGTDRNESGLYDMQGFRVQSGVEFKWSPTATVSNFRNYAYYVTDINAVQYFYAPTLQAIDGTESNVEGFIRNYDVPDIVNHIEYDNYGRQPKDYLPYTSANSLDGQLYPNPLSDVNTFYNTKKYENTVNPFEEKRYERSSLNRILEVANPGNDWKLSETNAWTTDIDTDHTNKVNYEFNTVQDKVKNYAATSSNGNLNLIDNGFYAANELTKTIQKNENWKPTQSNLNDNTKEVYTDKMGRTILSKDFNKGLWHNTYNVYDQIGNLTFVLPPAVYTYDHSQQIWENNNLYIEESTSWYNNGHIGYNEFNLSIFNDHFLNVSFSNFEDGPNAPLNTSTPVVDINFTTQLPDMDLGPVNIKLSDNSWNDTHYRARIQNGDIYLSGDGTAAYGVDFYKDIDINTIVNNSIPQVSIASIDVNGYQYKYDTKNRLIEKKLPGKDWEYIVYDALNRPVLTQDGNLRSQNKWLFVKYDVFNRLIYSGIWTNPTAGQTRSAVQTLIETQTTPKWAEARSSTAINIGSPSTVASYYTNDAFPKSNTEVLLIKYYDDYNFDLAGLTSEVSFGITPTTNAKTFPTGTKIKVLGTNSWVTNINYYDEKGRIIYTASNNAYHNTVDKIKSKYSFTAKVLETESTQIKGSFSVTVKDKFTYDHIDRIISQTQQINNQAEQLLFKNTYDELGRLVSKNVGGKTIQTGEQGLQKVDYSYNARGWLEEMNDITDLQNDLFAISYFRNENSNSPYTGSVAPGSPLYNSNISATTWKSDNVSSPLKSYFYNYDSMDRLNQACYEENTLYTGKFDEKITKYDRNGNILSLHRNTQSTTYPQYGDPMDQLVYNYQGNQLMGITDNYSASSSGSKGFKDGNTVGNDYSYDANGNMTIDKNKGIVSNIEYNHLNLPVKIVFNNADVNTANPKVILFKYDALGVKIEKTVYEPVGAPLTNTIKTIQYNNGAVYKNGTLEYFPQTEGYVSYDANAAGDKYSYVFQYKDNVGNVRVSYKDVNGDGIIKGATTEVFKDGFESAAGWNSQGFSWGQAVTAFDSTKSRSGNTSAKIVKPVTNGEWTAHSNTWVTINNSQPTDYIFSGWVYSDGPSADIFLFKSYNGETGYPASYDYVRTTQTNRWVYVEKRVTVPANFTKLNLRIDNNGGTNGSTVWFDNVSIRKVNPVNEIEIVEENNYYPFGLKHEGGIVTGLGNPLADQIKYQGQERNEELGLMWDSFKWRNYDPAMARFMTIDPLAESYTYNSTYAFQENKMGLGRELEGLELYNENGSINHDNASKAITGLINIACGVVGAVGTGAVIAETGGAGALVLGTSFMMSIGEIAIGISQVADALSSGPKDKALHDSGSIIGLIAHRNNSPNAAAWDAVGGLLPGVMSGGINAAAKGMKPAQTFFEITGFSAFEELTTATKNRHVLCGIIGTYDAFMDNEAFGDEVGLDDLTDAVINEARQTISSVSCLSPSPAVSAPALSLVTANKIYITATISLMPRPQSNNSSQPKGQSGSKGGSGGSGGAKKSGGGSGKGRGAPDGRQMKSVAIPRAEAVEYDDED